MSKGPINVLFTGISGFPYGLATIQKIKLLAMGLAENNCNVTVISKTPVHSPGRFPELRDKGEISKVKYLYTSGTPFRSKIFVKRNSLKIKGLINEFALFMRLSSREELDICVLYHQSFVEILYYFLVAKILDFKLIYVCSEFRSKISTRRLRFRLNDYLIDYHSFRFVNGILPISDYLMDHIYKIAPEIPLLKIPVLIDVNRFSGIGKSNNTNKYFLFCGALCYFEIIKFILDSFTLLGNSNVHIYLVVNGRSYLMNLLKEKIKKHKFSKQIQLFSNLTDYELNNLYINAKGLLIPLRPTIQDKARFPQKIGEYLLSGAPVLTTNYGEVKNYLVHGKTAYVANHYDTSEYMEIMKEALSSNSIETISKNGVALAKSQFDHVKRGKELATFLKKIINEG